MRTVARHFLATTAITLICSTMVSAELYHVDLSLSSLGIGSSVTNVELVIDLFDNDAPYDCYALIDNVILGTATDDFEDGTLGGFDDFFNENLVEVVSGDLDGTGSYVMRLGADLISWPSTVFRDYFDRDGDLLSFDVDSVLGPGDELVFSLVDAVTFERLVSGLAGCGDVAVIAADGLSVVPVPTACLLALLGFGSAGLKLRRQK